MRVLKPSILVLFLLVLSGCSKDVEENTPTNRSANLAGKWLLIDYRVTGNTTSITFDEVETAQFNGNGGDYNYTLTFQENPNTYSITGSYIFTLSTTNNSGNTIVQGSLVQFNEAGDWTQNNNTILVIQPEENYNLTIVELSDDTLRFTRNIDISTSSGDTATSTNATENYRFMRI